MCRTFSWIYLLFSLTWTPCFVCALQSVGQRSWHWGLLLGEHTPCCPTAGTHTTHLWLSLYRVLPISWWLEAMSGCHEMALLPRNNVGYFFQSPPKPNRLSCSDYVHGCILPYKISIHRFPLWCRGHLFCWCFRCISKRIYNVKS